MKKMLSARAIRHANPRARVRLALSLAGVMLAFGAHAQGVNVTNISKLVGSANAQLGTSATLVVPQMLGGTTASGGTAASLYAVPQAWTSVFIANDSSSQWMACGYDAGVSANGAGYFPIPPGQSLSWPPGTAPKNQPIYCAAGAAATPFHASVEAP